MNKNILLLRGAFLNKFECQNYESLVKKHHIIGIGSYTSIHDSFKFLVVKFFSPYDLVNKSGDKLGKPLRWIFNRTLGDSHFLFGMENWVRQNGPIDIAHIAETHYGYDLQAIEMKKKGLIKKVVSTCWETIPFSNETVLKKKRIKEIVKANTDLFICPTRRAKDALLQEGIDGRVINVIRIGVDLKLFKPKLNKTKRQTSTVNLLFIGRLVEEKGVIDLLDVYHRIHGDNQNVHLTVCGSGPLALSIKQSIEKMNLHKCVTIANKNYVDMPELYQTHDMLIVPSKTTKTWEEQYGMVLVEAMACGLPIVVYDSGAISEVLGNAGILVREGDENSLYKSIRMLMDDEYARYKYSLMARKRAEVEFDARKIAREIEKIYRLMT